MYSSFQTFKSSNIGSNGDWNNLTLREKWISRKSGHFIVQDNAIIPRTLYQVKNDWIHGWRKTTLQDDLGHQLYRLSASTFSLHGEQRIKDLSTGCTVATITRSGMVPFALKGGGKLKVWGGEVGRKLELEVSGSFYGRKFPIICASTGGVIALVRRKRFAFSMFIPGKGSNYSVSVRNESFTEFVLLLTVAIDHHYRPI